MRLIIFLAVVLGAAIATYDTDLAINRNITDVVTNSHFIATGSNDNNHTFIAMLIFILVVELAIITVCIRKCSSPVEGLFSIGKYRNNRFIGESLYEPVASRYPFLFV